MMKYLVLVLSLCVQLGLGCSARAEDAGDAAGYIIAYDLKGGDHNRGTVVIHNGQELPPKLWMPLFAGDTVFIHDAASSVVVEIAQGGRVEVKGERQRFTIGENAPGDGAWQILTQIAELFSSEEGEDAPTNLISKGGESLSVPMAVRGPNFILSDERPVWVAWRGGKGPYNLTLDVDDVRQVLGNQGETEIAIGIPKTVKDRFTLLIEDSLGKRVRIALYLRKSTPRMPQDLADQAARRGAEAAVSAGWLATHDDGAWRIEVARILRALPKDDKTAANLLLALANGWRPHE
jgi:hypothetical protein